jgi:anti-anti-sigma regulatory factor
MLRISEILDSQDHRVLLLEGKVCRQWLDELRTEIDRSVKAGEQLVLDFSKVTYIDEEGARLINRLPEEKVEKRNCSLFIRTMLSSEMRGEK